MKTSEAVCIYCGEPLSKWERIRCYCWNCSELTTAEPSHEENEDTI
jgi:predicted amidophosphoribosyltransferase